MRDGGERAREEGRDGEGGWRDRRWVGRDRDWGWAGWGGGGI